MRRHIRWLRHGLLPALIALAALAVPVTAHASGPYKILQKYSGKCMDLRLDSSDIGTVIQQYTCNGSVAQQWTLNLVPGTSDTYTIANVNGRCIEDESSFIYNGAPVDQALCNPYASQFQWKLIGPYQYGWYQIQNVLNPRCLATYFSTQDWAPLALDDCRAIGFDGGGSWDHQWQFTY